MKVGTIVGGQQVFAGRLDIGPDFLLSNVGGHNTKDLCSLTLRSHSKEDDEADRGKFLSLFSRFLPGPYLIFVIFFYTGKIFGE